LQLGLSSYSFPWAIGVPGFLPAKPMGAAALLQYAAQNGIHSVQFGDNLPLHLLPATERIALKEMAVALGMNIEVGTRRLTEENILLYLSIAQQFNSPFLRVVIDDADFHPDEKAVVGEIKKLLPQLRQANVILAIENHDRFPARTLERIIRSTDEGLVGICLDTANSLGAGEGVHEVLDVLAPYTVNLHIKDIISKRLPHKMGFMIEGCAAGQGLLNLPEILAVLKPHNRCRTATLEVWSGPEKTVQETMEKERQWVENSINYLKTLLP
jgi:sugar phosphate isomerase/epimerase